MTTQKQIEDLATLMLNTIQIHGNQFSFQQLATVLHEANYRHCIFGHWTGINGDECSECGRRLNEIMDADSSYAFEFEYSLENIKACPFCGAIMKEEK